MAEDSDKTTTPDETTPPPPTHDVPPDQTPPDEVTVPVGMQGVVPINEPRSPVDGNGPNAPSASEIERALKVLQRAGMAGIDPLTNQAYSDYAPQLTNPNLTDEERSAAQRAMSGVLASSGNARYIAADQAIAAITQRKEDLAASTAEAEAWTKLMRGQSKETVVAVPHNEIRAMRSAAAKAQARAIRADITIPGGKYLNRTGEYVNCNGDLIDESGKVLEVRSTPAQQIAFIRR